MKMMKKNKKKCLKVIYKDIREKHTHTPSHSHITYSLTHLLSPSCCVSF